jgi:hypothetical protein
LLGSHGKIVGASGRTDFDEDVAKVAKMEEMFTFCGADYVTLPHNGLSRDNVMRQHLADAEDPHAEQEGPAFLPKSIHVDLLISSEADLCLNAQL